MTVKIGHAHSDENTKAKGGLAGDQTGKEVVIQNWYNRAQGWTIVFRAKEASIAEKIAKTMEDACANNNIGYDQGQRVTLYKLAEKCNFNLRKITEKCECDCSSLVAVCVNAAGISVSKDMFTGNQKAVLSATRKFDMLTDTKYLTKADYLKRGDILLGPGHTAIVLSDSNSIDKASSFNKAFAGTYKVVADALNVRTGAGTQNKIITVIPKSSIVKCYGYYTKVLDAVWLYVQLDTKYTGFVSAKYLKKY